MMVISKTPYRISFFGGGTDYPTWYLKKDGAVLSTTIDKYCYITCRTLPPFFSHKYRIVWSHIEHISNVSEILHPAVRECLRFVEMDNDDIGLEITHQGDLPARSGMGSSSSFVVGLINALMAYKGKMIGKHELAMNAIEMEQSRLQENVGSQDQVAVAYGGFNVIRFYSDGEISVEPVTISSERIMELESRLMLFYTGSNRFASEIANEVISKLEKKQKVLSRMQSMVDDAVSILNGTGSLDNFGIMLHKNWELKQSISEVISNATINKIYKIAIDNGSLGGKLLGAGSAGFMVFYVPLEKQSNVKDALYSYLHVPFHFDRGGSSIVYYKPRCKK